jgi:hypothetical protein
VPGDRCDAARSSKHEPHWRQRHRRPHDAARGLRIEQCFGWGKEIGPIRQVMVQGLDKVDQLLTLTIATYNLTPLRSLAQLRPQCAQ